MDALKAREPVRVARVVLMIVLVALSGALLIVLFQPVQAQPLRGMSTSANMLALMPAAFFAGVLSFLSPCTLPILPAYFAFTFGQAGGTADQPDQERRRRRGQVLLSSLAFFGGLATTMITLGASFTAIGQLVGSHRTELARVGGAIVIIFGIMNLLGKGFSGMTLGRTQSATLAGAYLYGLTFAFGWTACIGPILGALLTMLATQGGTLVAGALLSLLYVLGLGLPLMIVAVFFGKFGQGSRFWRFLRGRGWALKVGRHTLYFHSSSILSGLMLIAVGALLVSGQLSYLNRYALSGPGAWAFGLEERLVSFFGIWGP